MQIHFLGGATTVTGSQFLLVTERAKVLIDCGMFQGSPNESIRNRIPFAFDPARARRRAPDPRPPRPLRAAAAAGQGRLPRPDPRHRRHGRARDARPARLGQAPRGVRQARGALGEAPPRRGRGRRPARGRRVPGGRRPGRRGRVGDGRGRRHRATDDRRRRGRRRLGGRRRGSRARRRRPSKPCTSPATRRPPGHATPRPSCAPSRRTSRSTSTRRCTRPRTPSARSRSSRPLHYGEEVEVAPGHPRHVRGRRPHPGLGDHPAPRPGARGRRGADHRLLRRPRPARARRSCATRRP